MFNPTTQELTTRNRTFAENLRLNGIDPLYMNRGTDLIARQIQHVREQEKRPDIEGFSVVELAHELKLDIHVCLKGRHENQYYCPVDMKEIKPLITGFGQLNKRLLCPRCLKSVPYATADELGHVIKGNEK